MSYTGRVDNITVTEHKGSVTLSVYNSQAWDNEPSTTAITFNKSSISNLIAALTDIKNNTGYDSW